MMPAVAGPTPRRSRVRAAKVREDFIDLPALQFRSRPADGEEGNCRKTSANPLHVRAATRSAALGCCESGPALRNTLGVDRDGTPARPGIVPVSTRSWHRVLPDAGVPRTADVRAAGDLRKPNGRHVYRVPRCSGSKK